MRQGVEYDKDMVRDKECVEMNQESEKKKRKGRKGRKEEKKERKKE